MVSADTLGKFRKILGLFTIILGAIGIYEAYEVALYILNLKTGTLETYSFSMTVMIYSLFILAILFVIYNRLEKRATK